ncbi:AP-5 complex subunit zeta-1-like isoform X2 [Hibiscus syriacus]|uniref:AP-5 complex subunit zeta-1-like isoform X2 n=1 Tax=Hibiscus syriacus TaxID=106335 RepID=UPI0019207BB8|nr:AP-5 complex subunit zeta-1-like isoform X2 [Hibiscus syriacus]
MFADKMRNPPRIWLLGSILISTSSFNDPLLPSINLALPTDFSYCEYANPAVAAATLDFLYVNKKKLLISFPNLLPQFFPLLLKLIAWNGEKLEKPFLKVFPGLVSPGSFLPLFPSLVDLPILVVALEKVERRSGLQKGNNVASTQKSKAPEMLLALMDEAYTGTNIGDGGGDSSKGSSTRDAPDPLFRELLKDENDGLSELHWASPGVAAVLQAVKNSPQSDRLKQILNIAPRLLDAYFTIALRDANNSLICALIPILMTRYSMMFPNKNYMYKTRQRLLEFMLAAFQHSPGFIALLKKPIIDRLGDVYESTEKTELALQLCWAVGEHGGGGGAHKDVARELFESLELLLYENLSSSRLGPKQESEVNSNHRNLTKSSQSRLLCFVITAIAKLATHHRELLLRASVALVKVARSRISDSRVKRRAQDYLGLMDEPGICLSVLGPSRPSNGLVHHPGTVNWIEGGTKMVAHIPFYILGEQEGPPFHDFLFSDVLPGRR